MAEQWYASTAFAAPFVRQCGTCYLVEWLTAKQAAAQLALEESDEYPEAVRHAG